MLAAFRTNARHVDEGVLGCAACGSEFRITDGIAWFDAVPPAPDRDADQEIAMRMAAFLELAGAAGFALLCGTWCAHTPFLARLVETPLVLVNPSRRVDHAAAAAVIHAGVLPFATGSAWGAAVEHDSPPALQSVVRSVRARGRIMGPARLGIPDGVTEIARDERDWVAEKSQDPQGPAIVKLRRA